MPFESPFYWVACVIGNVLLWSYLIYHLRHRLPDDGEITPEDKTVYEEEFASAHSLRDGLAPFFGARNCVEIKVTEDALTIAVMFPLSPLGVLFDLDHYVLKSRIASLERSRYFFREGLRIEYDRPDGSRSRFWLRPRNMDALFRAVNESPEPLRAAS